MERDVQLNVLIKLRNEMCRKKRLLPYQIFTCECAEAIVEAQPRNLEELGRVKGFTAGGRRHNKYGKIVLYTLQNADKIEGFDIAESDNEGVDITPVIRNMTCF